MLRGASLPILQSTSLHVAEAIENVWLVRATLLSIPATAVACLGMKRWSFPGRVMQPTTITLQRHRVLP
jgi:hypothetical protein